MTYFVTVRCYGSHLPGDSQGSFDHVRDGERRFIAPNAALERYHREHMKQPPFVLSPGAREVVRDAIVQTCEFRAWFLHALHVRTNHLHGVVDADQEDGQVLNTWKAYATRALRSAGLADVDRRIWAHGAGVQQVRSQEHLRNVVRYILNGQGNPMETFVPPVTHE